MCGRFVDVSVRCRTEMVWSWAVTSERDLGRLWGWGLLVCDGYPPEGGGKD